MLPVLMLLVMFWSTSVSTWGPFSCESAGLADLVFLVDRSWRIGDLNLNLAETILQVLVSPFHIGPDGVQIALTQYSNDPRTAWQLNKFTTKDQLLKAVRNLKYNGGMVPTYPFTGRALLYVLEENLKVESGARQNVSHFLVLLTAMKSRDDAIAASNRLKKTGVEIIVIGIDDADQEELSQVASEPLHVNLHLYKDYYYINLIEWRLARTICGKMQKYNLDKSSDDVRLEGGDGRCAGGVELKHQGQWRTVAGWSVWDLEDAAVVCRQLDCGSAISVGYTDVDVDDRLVIWRFEPDCSGSESSLRECGREERWFNTSSTLEVICSDILFQPRISLSSSMLGVSQDQHQGLQVFRDHSFTITCSIQPQYPGGFFYLTCNGSNTTMTHTLTAVNHSADFLFPAADHTHQGICSCVYEVYVFSHYFTSKSELLPLTVAANPLPAFIIRVVVVLLSLLMSNTALYLYFKTSRKPEERGSMELFSLHSRAEAGPGEERAERGSMELSSLHSRAEAGPGEERGEKLL